MENINIEEYIKDLSPELQEKARGCTSADELLKLAEENDIPLPDEVAEAVAGGKLKITDKCPRCGSKSIVKRNNGKAECRDCFYKFVWNPGNPYLYK